MELVYVPFCSGFKTELMIGGGELKFGSPFVDTLQALPDTAHGGDRWWTP